ncbi:MAG: CPBP family intramembrane metalloprotease [Dysgonamonadaceae bacterium]|jgi:membrane protease YdiL (CAAX protease family)|nr:CPBP family intramembrane metalloprotease [Dysgonamonadaceae bacterium]
MKGLLRNSTGFVQALMLLALIFVGHIVASVISVACATIQLYPETKDVFRILEIINTSPAIIRQVQFMSSVFAFLFPALFAAYLFSGNYKEYLHLETPFSGRTVFWTVASMIIVLPVVNFFTDLNMQMTLPPALKGLESQIRAFEEQAERLIKIMLDSDRLGDYALNVLIIAVLAALSEEILFRGVLQNIFGKFLRNRHVVIWAVAIIFSAIHFQFYGFLPRILLGAYFGYLLLYTGSMWIPILAHFTNNFCAVTVAWIYRRDEAMIEAIDAVGTGDTWWLALASAAVFLFCVGRIKNGVR